MKKLAFLSLVFISTGVFAKPMQVEILGENWTLGYDIGEVVEYRGIGDEESFNYSASTKANGNLPSTSMLVFIEKNAGQSNQTCYEELWVKNAKAYENEKVKIKHLSFPKYEQVIMFDKNIQGANFYFAKNGKCVNILMLAPEGTFNIESLMTQYGKSLKF